ncbi:(2Fe-2S)-binding protein [Gammaproteobacteria bacterium]|nr:(2Fe-2S)-binding protein [Gammaproteobacteria bacterium]
MKKTHIQTNINGDDIDVLVDPGQSLLDILRDELGMTGTKEGCATGDCGACSVTIDGNLVCACLILSAEIEDKRIETIEGMAEGDELHPLQQKFIEHVALQCGICTPGLLIAAKHFLEENPDPTAEEVRYGIAGNLCRCTGYQNIINAIMDAAAEMRGT